MDIGSVRPVISGISAPVPRAPAAAEQASNTDLPVRSAVTRTNDSATTGDANSEQTTTGQQTAEPLRDAVVFDDKTRTVIYQQIDDLTGQVVDQVPAEGRLRMRAMIDAWMGARQASQTPDSVVA